jgi:hypothetical protein
MKYIAIYKGGRAAGLEMTSRQFSSAKTLLVFLLSEDTPEDWRIYEEIPLPITLMNTISQQIESVGLKMGDKKEDEQDITGFFENESDY